MLTLEQINNIIVICNYISQLIDNPYINKIINKVNSDSSLSKSDIKEIIMIYNLIKMNKYDVLKKKYNIDNLYISDIKMPDIDTAEISKEISKKDHTFVPRKLYISDLHFYHGRLNTIFDNRGFASMDEMNEYMIKQWNNNVNKCDNVYILGDFSFAKSDNTTKILSQLKGNKYLIKGNHDKFLDDSSFNKNQFVWIKDMETILDKHRKVVLSHYPIFCYPNQYKPDTYMLYGHVHNTQDEKLVNQFINITKNTIHERDGNLIPCNMINCFCMFSNYVPLTLDEWIEVDKKRRANM